MGAGGHIQAPAALPPVKYRYPLCRKPNGPKGRSGRVWIKSRFPPGFDRRTVQPVAIRYADWAIAAHEYTGWRGADWHISNLNISPAR